MQLIVDAMQHFPTVGLTGSKTDSGKISKERKFLKIMSSSIPFSMKASCLVSSATPFCHGTIYLLTKLRFSVVLPAILNIERVWYNFLYA
jgi:hypothetical protein